jgi:hypothetical protein
MGVSTMGSVIVALDGTGRMPAPRERPRAGVWLLRCRLPGGVLTDRWFSIAHGLAPSWVVFR